MATDRLAPPTGTVIEPAWGSEREQIIRDINRLLGSESFRLSEFNAFTSKMIDLLGGVWMQNRSERESRELRTPFGNVVFNTFNERAEYPRPRIEIEHDAVAETLAYRWHHNAPDHPFIIHGRIPLPPTYSSGFSGREEQYLAAEMGVDGYLDVGRDGTLAIGRRTNSEEVKVFARRVLDVYETAHPELFDPGW